MITDFQKNIDETLGSQVLVGLFKHFLEHATLYGINRSELLLQGGLTEEQLGDSNQCIPLSYFEKAVSYTYGILKNPLISLSFSKSSSAILLELSKKDLASFFIGELSPFNISRMSN